MRVLISNDDGYQAPGIQALAKGVSEFAEIVVVAPDRNRSGASNSLTLESPIRATKAENGFISVNGTPTDCVHLAITGLLDEEPDMVISGINAGSNLGDDVIYSGTVAAAMEGRFLGLPAIALSMNSQEPKFFETGVKVVQDLLRNILANPLPADTILNVNIPDQPWDQIQGIQVTRLGHRHRAEPVIKEVDPRGNSIYWVGPAGPEQDAGKGTDFYAVNNGFVSITPLQVDLTKHTSLNALADWVKTVDNK